jgi:hypothetical protein
MTVLHIEHPVRSFESWQKAFDADPVDRRGSGVRGYRVLRAADDPKLVVIELEFATTGDAERMLGKLRELWARVQDSMFGGPPRVRILELASAEQL